MIAFQFSARCQGGRVAHGAMSRPVRFRNGWLGGAFGGAQCWGVSGSRSVLVVVGGLAEMEFWK